MTVKELIKKLQEFDENQIVEIYATYDCGFCAAGGNITNISIDNNIICLESGEG